MSQVYFAQPKNGGPIKVGMTSKLKERKIALGSWIPGGVEIIATVPGGKFRESYLKEALRPFAFQGEWHRSCPDIWAVIIEASESSDLPWLPSLHLAPNSSDLIEAVESDFGDVKKLAALLGYQRTSVILDQYGPSNVLLARLWIRVALDMKKLPQCILKHSDIWPPFTWPPHSRLLELVQEIYCGRHNASAASPFHSRVAA